MVFASCTTKPGRAASSSGHPVRGERRTSVAAGMDGAVEARALARLLQGALHLLFPGSGGVQLILHNMQGADKRRSVQEDRLCPLFPWSFSPTVGKK